MYDLLYYYEAINNAGEIEALETRAALQELDDKWIVPLSDGMDREFLKSEYRAILYKGVDPVVVASLGLQGSGLQYSSKWPAGTPYNYSGDSS